MANHYNFGMVIGSIIKTRHHKTTNGNTYVNIRLDCKNTKSGKLTVLGRIWGNKRIKSFLDLYQRNQKSVFKFKGVLSQYKKEDTCYSSYLFWDWSLAGQGKESRATFVLRGRVENIEPNGDTGRIFLNIKRQGYPKESLELLAPDEIVRSVPYGFIEAKGILIPEEDYYGSEDTIAQPHVMEFKELKQVGGPDEQVTEDTGSS